MYLHDMKKTSAPENPDCEHSIQSFHTYPWKQVVCIITTMHMVSMVLVWSLCQTLFIEKISLCQQAGQDNVLTIKLRSKQVVQYISNIPIDNKNCL